MADDRGPPPLCKSCTHHHHEGEKCPICGHTGKGKAFSMISKTTGPSNPNLHFECFDKRTDPKLFKNQWALVRILRNKIFIDECSVPEDQEFDLQEENSRHVLGLVGDAPVLYARWRLDGAANESRVAVVDRLAVMPKHRNRGYSNRTLEFLFQDIASTVNELKTAVVGLVVTPPVDMPVMLEKLQRRGFVPMGEAYLERSHAFQRYYLPNTQQPGPA